MKNYKLLALYCKANPKSNSLREATIAGVLLSHFQVFELQRELYY